MSDSTDTPTGDRKSPAPERTARRVSHGGTYPGDLQQTAARLEAAARREARPAARTPHQQQGGRLERVSAGTSGAIPTGTRANLCAGRDLPRRDRQARHYGPDRAKPNRE